MPRLPDRLPSALSGRIISASGASYSHQGREVDVALGGIPFRLATFNDEPLTIETIPVRKDQVDTEIDPGEQSLSGWWRRSQSSFHQGAGYLYEPVDTQEAHEGFWDSSGVNVFTPGQIELLKKMDTVMTSETLSRMRTYAINYTRQNLCPNPSFETNTTDWSVGHGGNAADTPTLTRVTAASEGISTPPSGGTYVGKLTWATDDATSLPPSLDFPVVAIGASTTFSVSVMAYVPTGSTAVGLIGHSTFGTGTGITKDEWVECTLTATTGGSGNTQCVFWPSTPVSAGEVFYVDTAIMELGNLVGNYFDGDSPNASWDGAADNSTSTLTVTSADSEVSVITSGGQLAELAEDGTLTDIHDPSPEVLVDGLVTNGNFYSIDSDSTLYEGLVSSPGTATTWPLTAAADRLAWGKHRLWIIGGRNIWQPDLTLAAATNQNPIFTNPNRGWTYTCIAEGSSAMYFGGHDGFTSSIQAVTLDSDGSLPTLSGAAVTAVLPDGEFVQEMAGLAGQYIGIGTNKGFRVGVTGPNQTTIVYGPLLFEPDGVLECTSITTQGKFFLVSFRTDENESVAYRVDTSLELDEGVFPYAKDVEGSSGAFISLATKGERVFGITENGMPWFQSATEYVDEGWLQSSRIRFRTTEPKSFKYVDLEIEPLEGAIQLEFITDNDSTLPIGNVTIQGDIFTDAFAINHTTMKHAALKITMTPQDDGTPVINSFLVRAMPAVTPQRLITIPLLCYDYEQSRSGQRYGGQGYGMDRLLALQTLEDSAESFVYQNFSDGTNTGRTVIIERLQFRQTTPSQGNVEGAGGILIAQLRTVEA